MTVYATEDDINANLKGITITASSSITPDNVTSMILQESAVIDQHLLAYYDLPITDETSLELLKKICIDLVIYRITKILQPKSALPAPDGKMVQDISEASAYRDAMKRLDNIMAGKATLPGETIKTITIVNSTSDAYTPVFEAEEQQW